jgi:hypothetical protein
MKNRLFLSLALLLLAAPMAARADQLVSAGSVIQCTVAEAKISSKTEKIGDPILCQLGHTEAYGRTVFPYGSYIVGHFEDYKDPGHFVGKGWMELRFDRMVVQPDTIVPINARVVQVPKYPVDQDGRIHGTGHAVRDTIEWLIPVLWPIDLINLPRRGPRPELKPESRLTLKVLEDFGIPTPQENAVRTPALVSRITPDEPTYQSYRAAAEPLQQPPAPVQRYAPPAQQSYAPAPQQYAPVQQSYTQPVYTQPSPVVVNFVQQSAPPVIVQQASPVVVQPRVMYGGPVYVPRPAYGPYGYGYRMGPYGPY